MNYKEFKNILEQKSRITADDYQELIKICGEDKISQLFERYINDKSVPDDSLKFARTYAYLDACQNINFELIEDNKESEQYQTDSVKQYLQDIGRLPLLTIEEENTLGKKIKELREELQAIEFSYDNFLMEIVSLGYEYTKDTHTLYDIEKQVSFYEKTIINLRKNNEISEYDIREKVVLLEEAKKYLEYRTVVEKFASGNLRLPVSIAKHYVGKGVTFQDLIQEGNQGLLKAIDRFDVDKGFKFSTYATWWIRQTISRFIADNSRTIRIPVHFHEMVSKYVSARNLLEVELGKEPTDKEMIDYFKNEAIKQLREEGIFNPTEEEIRFKTKVKEEDMDRIKKVIQGNISLYTPIGEDKDNMLQDFIPDEGESTEDLAMKTMLKEIMIEELKTSSPRERLVIALRFGLDLEDYVTEDEFIGLMIETNFKHRKMTDIEEAKAQYRYLCYLKEEHTLESCGSILKVTRERIRQIEYKTLNKLCRRNSVKALKFN